jgi:hypothetical protein
LIGQLTLQFVLSSYAALYFAQRRPLLSGVALAISIIKPTFGVPIALLMLIQGHVRAVLYGGLVAAAANIPLLLVLAERSGGIDAFLNLLLHNRELFQQHVVNNPASSIIRVDASAFLSRVIREPIGIGGELVIFILVLFLAGWAIRQVPSLQREENRALSVGVISLATLLCSYHQGYDLLILVLPFVAILHGRFPETFYYSYRYPLSVALLMILALNFGSSHSVMPFIREGSALWLFMVSINSIVLIVLFCLWTHALGSVQRSRQSNLLLHNPQWSGFILRAFRNLSR